MKQKKIILALILAFLSSIPLAHAESGDLGLQEGSIRSKTDLLAGKTVRIYATVKNYSNADLLGMVKFYDESKGAFIGADQPISVVANGTDDVFVDWETGSPGTKKISARIVPWTKEGDNPGNNKISASLYVDVDSDEDGLPNQKDPDDDNDAVKDEEDAFPLDSRESLDTDKDGVGNNTDEDDDGDGSPDIQDLFPDNPKETTDRDNDGTGDNSDQFPDDPKEALDADGDGMGANTDFDDQNKGPEPVIQIESLNVKIKEKVRLDASSSSDPDGDVKSYEWLIGSEEMEGDVVETVFDQSGDYNVQLTVTDDKGESRTKTITLQVRSEVWIYLVVIGGVILTLGLSFLLWRSRKHKKPLSKKTK